MDTDKRRHPRVALALHVEFPDQPSLRQAWTENLSEGGTFVSTDHSFEVGQRLTIILGFPGLLEPLAAEVEVVRVQPQGIGVRFVGERSSRVTQIVTKALSEEPPAARQTFRLLLVEDNEHVLRLYQHAMRRLPTNKGSLVEVETASDGFLARQRLEQEPPVDLVISDVFMPVMDGFALVEHVRSTPRLASLPIVVISIGGVDVEMRMRALGVTIFMEKPVQLAAIVATVRTLLGIRPTPAVR